MTTREECLALDTADPLRSMRDRFDLDEADRNGLVYLDGNSLGPLPRSTVTRLAQVVTEEWGTGLIRSWNTAGWISLANRVGDKIAALGGVPSVLRNEVKQSRDIREVLEFSLAFESKAVDMYTQAIELAEGNRALVIFLEDILKEEQEGVDEYTKLLRETPAHQAELSSSKKIS